MRTKSTPHVMKLSSCLNYNYLLMISVLHSNLRGAFSTNSASISSLSLLLLSTAIEQGLLWPSGHTIWENFREWNSEVDRCTCLPPGSCVLQQYVSWSVQWKENARILILNNFCIVKNLTWNFTFKFELQHI